MIESSDLLTIALLVALEGLLSADNALVIAVMVLGLPKEQRRGALHYGLIGAFAFRIVATLLAIYLMQLVWVKLLGGLYLLYLTYSHFQGGKTAEERQTPPQATPWLGLSAFWATVIRVELVNLAFSIDSILVAVAVSPKRWVGALGRYHRDRGDAARGRTAHRADRAVPDARRRRLPRHRLGRDQADPRLLACRGLRPRRDSSVDSRSA
jgi:predicted tellurium resistance membrane protein TerC